GRDEGVVIAGIRPESFEDADLLRERGMIDEQGRSSEAGTGVVFEAEVELVESMGTEIYAYFKAEVGAFGPTKLGEIAEQIGYESGAETDQVIARLDAASEVRRVQKQAIWFNSHQVHLFVPETGEALLAD